MSAGSLGAAPVERTSPPSLKLQCGTHVLDLSAPRVMGVLNVTPDSFSDGGRYDVFDRAVARAWKMVEEGASIIDIGGESTRPGAATVSPEEELRRVLPIVSALVGELPVPISVDTRRAEVMRQVLDAGAGMINDVNALREPGAIEVVAQSEAAVCLMHMQGQPQTMQQSPVYHDVVGEVREFFGARIDACVAHGISARRIVLDPGIGFGKTVAHNLALLQAIPELAVRGLPVLIGVSRKSLIGAILGEAGVDERMFGSIGGAVAAALCGARLLRVHDVKATADALKVASAFALTGEGEE